MTWKFDDRHEGSIPKPLAASMKEWEARYTGEEARAKYREERLKTRRIVVVNCWHVSTHESEAMWRLYGLNTQGIAIRSSVDRLALALPQRSSPKEPQGWEAIYLTTVQYIDYDVDTFPSHNLYYPFVHKRQSLRHESELRAITMISDAAEATPSGASDFVVSEMGLAIPVDLETLIDSIYLSPLAPPSLEGEVLALLQRFGLDSIPVVRSDMAEDPIY